MKEIKFRAWDKEKKEMREVTSLNFYDEYMWVDETPMTGDRLPLETTPLMQYTGLKDKNGKEIYEGDIVSWGESPKMFIKFGEGMFEFWETETEKAYHWGIWNIHKELEVIGNIYENKDLLT